MKKNMTL